ncbi:bifunctional tRNA (5-methylaminomethyl-2-thiouridine)(34)-methyltransferase MnmD/FAD-dependent 5-carboxymethylaminomethyl-2-thiouridine(34) oxidoreductase MnmC [Aliidiomarina indica]|uniref:bifunctional tRNA (5-methylaminomethyl-2-thiouridine)(34)-methyltransferase MnmD/FAD-dependent 5-carboxymethylaminomethyl-2-thiouridine(34) oxidoreductase MnmC n=1 Tax=Aliidiomarina indica TaxID=2749147 RepID=UPI00188DD134|nr:bifunctional tRNA (5-methylaminomethyl-2-thiouridine)(34)-methyltransferase MnmD/FAD-dependent 5-carboxymethylaminomethyl-2-thiouridine(34) oxidoreductase MnmC [Aliidiomarina indica]
MSQPHKSIDIEYAQVSFDDRGTPESKGFGDIYFNRSEGVAESAYVFLEQNKLSERFYTWREQRPFVIAETGFGTGLNCLLAAALFIDVAPADARLHLVSVEGFPLSPADLEHALEAIIKTAPQIRPFAEQLLATYPPALPGIHRLHLHDRVALDLIFGDVLDCYPAWSNDNKESVDAWFLDGFAPKKNPQMWQTPLFNAVARSLRVHGTLATFTATGKVRRGLSDAGISMRKERGFAKKRDMLVGIMQRPAAAQVPVARTHLAIVGNGIASANLAWSLRHYPGTLSIIAADEPASGASGNPQGAVYPLLQANWTATSAFYSSAFVYARERYLSVAPEYSHFDGLIDYVGNENHFSRLRKMKVNAPYPSALFAPSTAAQLAGQSDIPLHIGGAHYPSAGWIEPAATVRQLFQKTEHYRKQQGLITHSLFQHDVKAVSQSAQGWVIQFQHQTALDVSHLVLATGERLTELLPQMTIPIRPVRGQITRIKAKTSGLSSLNKVLCRGGYIVPPLAGHLCIGATFDKTHTHTHVLNDDHQKNLTMLQEQFGVLCAMSDVIDGRASVRATTPDHLPIAGRLERYDADHDRWRPLTNFYVLSGLGARGLTSAPLAAEIIASDILQQPMPIDGQLAAALEPMRFAKRALRKGISPLALR